MSYNYRKKRKRSGACPRWKLIPRLPVVTALMLSIHQPLIHTPRKLTRMEMFKLWWCLWTQYFLGSHFFHCICCFPSIHLVHTIYYLTDNYDVVYGINLYTVMSYLKMPQANAFLILHIKMLSHWLMANNRQSLHFI